MPILHLCIPVTTQHLLHVRCRITGAEAAHGQRRLKDVDFWNQVTLSARSVMMMLSHRDSDAWVWL